MVRSLFLVFAAALAWAGAYGSALAVGEDVFVVPRVAVQAQADSATTAKLAAQRDGRRRAMTMLLRRLTADDDWARLPTSGGLNDGQLEALESAFEVYNEKSSSKTYRAFITYRFKPEAVRKLLKDLQIPYSEAQTPTALVIPVLQTGNGVYLWEENNPWMAAWKIRPYTNELTPMIAPLGDLEDASSVTARQAVAVNSARLATLAERYSVSRVIVAHAFLQQRDGEDRLRVRLINGYVDADGLGGAVSAEALGLEDDMAAQGATPNSTFNPTRIGEVLAEEWFSQPSGNFPVLAERAIEGAVAQYARPWKRETLIDHTVAALLDVSAFYSSIAEWSKIRTALTSTPLVGAVQVRSLSRGGAELLLQAFGDPAKLATAMEAQGLVFWSADGEQWSVATPSAARQWQNQSAYDERNRRDRRDRRDDRY